MRETILAQIHDKELLDRLDIQQNDFSQEQIRLFKENPEVYRKLVKEADRIFNDKYKVVGESSSSTQTPYSCV